MLRRCPSASAINCMARTFGAPLRCPCSCRRDRRAARRDRDAVRPPPGKPDASRMNSGQLLSDRQRSDCPAYRCAQVIARQIDQHQMFGKPLWSVRMSSSIRLSRSLSSVPSARRPRGRVPAMDKSQSDGWLRHIQRAFGDAPKSVKSLSCIKNIYGLGLLFSARRQPTATGRAVKSGATAPPEISRPRGWLFATGVPPRRTRHRSDCIHSACLAPASPATAAQAGLTVII